ncbi:hypothetical protein R3P38DRAFT_1656130 [Favolaschia claudopus]|uniref:Uncharacterized protein n=1 Tax=Favolaschia claudopus TaxID=2862362 RepID=A0AAW0AE21_9AGAR
MGMLIHGQCIYPLYTLPLQYPIHLAPTFVVAERDGELHQCLPAIVPNAYRDWRPLATGLTCSRGHAAKLTTRRFPLWPKSVRRCGSFPSPAPLFPPSLDATSAHCATRTPYPTNRRASLPWPRRDQNFTASSEYIISTILQIPALPPPIATLPPSHTPSALIYPSSSLYFAPRRYLIAPPNSSRVCASSKAYGGGLSPGIGGGERN